MGLASAALPPAANGSSRNLRFSAKPDLTVTVPDPVPLDQDAKDWVIEAEWDVFIAGGTKNFPELVHGTVDVECEVNVNRVPFGLGRTFMDNGVEVVASTSCRDGTCQARRLDISIMGSRIDLK